MSKYETGSYHVLLFDRYGSKQHTQRGFTGLLVADAYGQSRIQEEDMASYVVIRVLRNSLDHLGSYNVDEKDILSTEGNNE